MPELVVPVVQEANAVVEGVEQVRHQRDEGLVGYALPQDLTDDTGVGHQLLEGEAPTEGHIHQRDGPVGGVHGPEDVQVGRDREAMLRGVGQRQLQLVAGRQALVRLQQGDQLAQDLAHVAAVDLVDDQHVLRRARREGEGGRGPRLVQGLLDPSHTVDQLGLARPGRPIQVEELGVNE